MRARIAALIALAVIGLLARQARAGRTHYGWLYGTEVNPEHGVEVETWILEENGKGDLDQQETTILWQPTLGLTEHLELAVPIELSYERAQMDPMDPGATGLNRWGVDLRYRLNSSDPILAGPVTALIRVAAKRPVVDRKSARAEADLVVAYEQGIVHAEVDLGTVGERAGNGDKEAEFRPGGGISLAVTSELRLGAEIYSELGITGETSDWVAAGPTLGLTKGRFWLAGTFAIGLSGIDSAPRIDLAIAF